MMKRLFLCLFLLGALFLSVSQAQESPIKSSLGTRWDSLGQVEKNSPNWEYVIPPKFGFGDIQVTGTPSALYFVVKEKGFWGMYDDSGKELIAPNKYVKEPKFTEDAIGVAYFNKDGKEVAIYIDKTGAQVVPGEFYMAWPFVGDYAGVFKGPGMDACFFVDRQGKAQTKEYGGCSTFFDGMAQLSYDKKLWGYLDKDLKVAVEPKYQRGQVFSEGLAAVFLPDNGKCGYINKDGSYQIEPKFKYCGPFAEGVAEVSEEAEDARPRKFYFIDKDGKQLFNGLIVYAEDAKFSNGLLPVRTIVEKVETCPGVVSDKYFLMGAINAKGETVVPFDFFEINSFNSEGYADAGYKDFFVKSSGKCVGKGKGISVKVSKTGKIYEEYAIVPALVDSSVPFWQKLVVNKGTKLDSDGWSRYGLSYFYNEEPEKVFIPPQFHRVIHLTGPYFKVEVEGNGNGPWGVIKVKE